ncbi:MAG: glycosyltransferase [Cytophagaceae bacterium]
MNVIISQALATGLPVITTRHSGLPDQIIDGKNGYLVDEGDFISLAEKILFFFNNPEIWSMLSVAARNHVKRTYDLSRLIEEQIECYQKLLISY